MLFRSPNVQELDALDVEYMLPLVPANVSDCVQRFAASKKGVNGTHLTYAQLTKWGAPADWFRQLSFSPTAFDYSEGLSSKPGSNGGTEPGRDRAMGLRVTFFEGGLVLGFAFHHAVMDGPSIKRFLQVFSAGFAANTRGWDRSLINSKRVFMECSGTGREVTNTMDA